MLAVVFLSALVSGQLKPFLSGQMLLCPQQTAMFTCTSAGVINWALNNNGLFFFPENVDGVQINGDRKAVTVANSGGERTSILLFDSFPSGTFTVNCNQDSFIVEFSGDPGSPTDLASHYIEVGSFFYFNVTWDTQTVNVTFRVEISGFSTATSETFLLMAIEEDSVNSFMVEVRAINPCKQESVPAMVMAVKSDTPTTGATGAMPTTEVMPTVSTTAGSTSNTTEITGSNSAGGLTPGEAAGITFATTSVVFVVVCSAEGVIIFFLWKGMSKITPKDSRSHEDAAENLENPEEKQ